MSVQRAMTLGPPAVSADLPVAAVRDLIRRHGLAILVALLLAGTLVFPRWWVLASSPEDGVRIPISPYGAGAIGYDESLYTSSIRHAFDGHVPVSDPYLENHRSVPPQRNAVPHEVIGTVGRVVGGPFEGLAVATTLAAAAGLVLLYTLLYRITESRWAAVALIPIVLVGIHVLNQAEGILPLRHKEILAPILRIDPERELHAWSRFPAPIFVLGPFFAAVLALPRAVDGAGRRWMLLAAVSLALLVYTYAYYWTAVAVALLGWLCVLGLRREREQAVRLAKTGALALVMALPELIVLAWSTVSLPDDARARVGLEGLAIDTSLAVTILQRLAFGVPFLAVLNYGRSRNVLYAGLFLAPLLLTPTTGLIPQPWHFHTQVWGVFAIPALVAGGAALLSAAPVARLVSGGRALLALSVLAAICASYVVAMQARALAQTDDAFAISRDEESALAWLRVHTNDRDTVVSPSVTTNLLLASLTPASEYIADGGFSTAHDEELIERILRVQAAFGYSEEAAFLRLNILNEFDGFPVNDATATTADLERDLEEYLAFFTFSFEITDQQAFTDRVNTWRPRYRELLDTDAVLSAYPADYLYCSRRERFFDAEAPAPGTYVRPAHESGPVVVYEIVARGDEGAREFTGC
ncbi:MAG: hypothetical protein HY873_07745 [Chloroflexi bacterium]|nr:hypothetical protein [Chloroflexota bacterium]